MFLNLQNLSPVWEEATWVASWHFKMTPLSLLTNKTPSLKNIDFPNQEVISASAQYSWALLLEKLEIWTNDSRDLILYFQGEKSLSQK